MTNTTASLDAVTDRAGIVVSHRDLVPLTTWFADALAMCAERRLGLQLVTAATSRITVPLEYVLDSPDARWVVRSADGSYFDGVRGVPLSWDGATFVASSATAPSQSWGVDRPAGGLQGGAIRIHASVSHPAARDLELGRLAEECIAGLTGHSPTGWGIAEPASQGWSRRQITRVCRDRAPAPTWLVVVGGKPTAPAVGVLESKRSATGVVERLRLCVGSGATDAVGDLDAIDRLAVRLAESFDVRSMTAFLQPGYGDAAVRPASMGAPIPYGLLVGPAAVADHGAPPESLGGGHELVGPGRRKSCWMRLMSLTQPQGGYESLLAALRHFGLPLPATS